MDSHTKYDNKIPSIRRSINPIDFFNVRFSYTVKETQIYQQTIINEFKFNEFEIVVRTYHAKLQSNGDKEHKFRKIQMSIT